MPSTFRAYAQRFAVPAMAALALSAGAAAGPPVAPAGAPIAEPAWLEARLPAHTVAYARIPSFWGMVSAPDGRAFDPALGGVENARIVASLAGAVRRNALVAATGAGPFLDLWMSDLGSPVEIALTDPGDQITPAGNVLLVTRVNVPDIATLNARMAALAGATPILKAPFDANGSAELTHNGVLQFDAASHRLFLFAGIGATRVGLDQAIAQLAQTRPHPMQALEHEIDESGQGLFVWINTRNLASTYGPPQGQKEHPLSHDLLEHMQEMAFGWGTVHGRGSMRWIIVAPGARLLDYYGQGRIDGNLRTAGRPRWMFTMMLPGDAQLRAIEAHLDDDYGAGTAKEYRTAMARIQARLGVVPMDFASTVGPELILFGDANGTFTAFHLRDKAGFYALLDRLGARFGWRSASRRVGNLTIHELHIPSGAPEVKPGTNARAEAWERLVGKIGNHLYWVEEGNYLVAAQVPQPLIDRAASRLDTRLADVLQQTDSGHGPETLLGLSGTSAHAQRDMYYAYLSSLQTLGDLLDQPVDLLAMPAAGSLQLPVDGQYDFGIEASRSRLEFGLGYEQSPMEIVTNGSGSIGAVGVLAVLAAIAIPAYEDYEIRTQVAEGAVLAGASKTAVAEYFAKHRKLPANNLAAGVPAPAAIHGRYASSVTITNGRIVVAFGGPAAKAALPASKVLVFAPRPSPAGLTWDCTSAAGTTVDVKYRPMACRP